MAETLTSPDLVDLVRSLLLDQLPDIPEQDEVPVTRAVPSPRPATFITLKLVGGAGRDSAVPGTDRARLAFEAWGATPEQAHDLAVNARAVVLSAQGTALGGTQIYRVDDGGYPADVPDPLSDQPRFTFTAEFRVRTRRPPAGS